MPMSHSILSRVGLLERELSVASPAMLSPTCSKGRSLSCLLPASLTVQREQRKSTSSALSVSAHVGTSLQSRQRRQADKC